MSNSSFQRSTFGGRLGDIAWVTGRGQNTGTFNGMPMEADEYITDIYCKVNEGGAAC